MTEFFSHIAFAQMLMCALLLFPLRKQNSSIPLYIILMLCGSGYLLSAIFPPIETGSALWWLGRMGGNALPGVFWLVSLSVFCDHSVLKRWQYIVASLTLLVPLLATIIEIIFSISLKNYEGIYGLITYGALLLELVLISHALLISAQHWRDDLVQERRYIRGGVIAVSSLYIILVIVFEQLLKVDWPQLTVLTSFLLAMLITSINFFLFQLKESSLFETVNDKQAVVITKVIESKSSQELIKIVESMEEDKLYQQDGMTISGLAKHLAIHEYKLRNLINGELNYRNFNDFLNFYRIKEVTESLVSPSFSHLPVLTLALESGFRSLSSFNKAFKNTHGITPTEYRKKNISE
ncbi:MAG: AraC family transcriptional regulator [Colwelliaceae bacterium]|nr:AraC family transcriptional regulator [Colwelliaceae bacterium]